MKSENSRYKNNCFVYIGFFTQINVQFLIYVLHKLALGHLGISKTVIW